jgi:hypothetical protein
MNASGPVFIFCRSGLVSAVRRALCPVFMYCAPRLLFGGTEDVGSLYHHLPFLTHFRRYRGRRVPYSCFARPDSFSAVPWESDPVFMFCAPGLVFGGVECVVSLFHVLRSRTRFRRKRGRQVPFSCFAFLNSFSAVSWASGPFFMFCAPGLIFGGTEGVGSRFHILRSRTHFQRYRGRWVPFSCFARSDSFSAVPRASGPIFMFCAPRLIFDGTEGVGSRTHVLRSQTHFQWYRGRRVPSCYVLPESFSTVTNASGPVFKFSPRVLIFGGNVGVESRFYVFRSHTRFRRYGGRRVPFSYFALPKSFSVVLWASGPVFIFCAPTLIFGGTEGVGSHFHVLRSRNRFQRYRGRRVSFSCFLLPD